MMPEHTDQPSAPTSVCRASSLRPWALLLAAGRGSRMAAATGGTAKQFLLWKGLPLYWHSALTFSRSAAVAGVVFVFPPDELPAREAELRTLDAHAALGLPWKVACGGAERHDSVRNGLAVLPREATHVLVHDAARPFVSARLVREVRDALADGAQAAVQPLPLIVAPPQSSGTDQGFSRSPSPGHYDEGKGILVKEFITRTAYRSPKGNNSRFVIMEYSVDPTGKEATRMQMLFAPNNYHLLQHTNKLSASDKDLELEDLVYLGWPLFKWINRFFIIYIFDWLSSWGLSMGVVLLLLTILVKLLVYPTTRKSYLSSARMRVLKPKVDEINAKYPNPEDAMKKQQEIMQLYSQYGVSPMGGCLPMLIQMPIWIALFNFVPNAIELRGESFLWASDLSAYDDVIRWNKHIWLIGDHLSIFCLLFCLTNIVNTWISMRQQKDTMTPEQAQQMKLMQYMMYLMPIVFFFMFNNYSSGLNYYYFLSGLTSILIMWFLRKTTDEKKLLAKLEANYQANKANPNKKLSGMAARLEALQKQQQAILEEQKKRQAQQHKK